VCAAPGPQVPVTHVARVPGLEIRNGDGPERNSQSGGDERGPGARFLTDMGWLLRLDYVSVLRALASGES
jgi:hypothetical protein